MLNSDVSTQDQARALHRVVRAMHDGECPNCGYFNSSESFRGSMHFATWSRYEDGRLECPFCHFTISDNEQRAALRAFRPFMQENLRVYRQWIEASEQAADTDRIRHDGPSPI